MPLSYETIQDDLRMRSIKERSITGLRSIDEELDLIFSQPESISLMKAFARNANPRENPQSFARQLLELGVRRVTPPEEAAQLFKAHYIALLEHYHLQEEPMFRGQPELMSDLVQVELENPESLLNQALKNESPKFLWRYAGDKIKTHNREQKERRERLGGAAEARRAQRS